MVPEHGQSQSSPEKQLELPVLIFGVVEVRRLLRELEALDEFMRQAAIREPGKPLALPRMTRLLEGMTADNNRNLLKDEDRTELKEFLATIEKTAPSVHISFASDPSAAFVVKLVTWLRANIHPQLLLQIGLQPTIAAGCVVRTPNKNFDLSLRQSLLNQRPKLIDALNALDAPKQPVAAQPEAQA